MGILLLVSPGAGLVMMKFLLFFGLVAVSSVAAWPQLFGDSPLHFSKASKQQTVNRLLYKIAEPLKFEELSVLAETFDPLGANTYYTDDGAAAKLLMGELADDRLLEQHHWFSLFNDRQREEALMLFDVLMNCVDWSCAVGNAAFFREKMNEGEFVYSLATFVTHAPLAKGVVLPPLYEITPHMFTNSEIIQKAYSAQMTRKPGHFAMDFTGSLKNPEQHVAYFGEDIGMNVHHVTWHMDFPFWWEDKYGYHLDRKGELFFWAHHQLTVRFDSERLSNHLDMVEPLYWDQPIVEGFAPHTTYRYGGEFPTRPDNIDFEDVDDVIRVRDMIIHEARIIDAIDLGYITKEDGSHLDIMNARGIDHLGDIIESSMYSPNIQYYGALHNHAHILLGRQSDPKGKFDLPPSVMEHFETATRDPAFFRLHKYMDNIFKEHKDILPSYTPEEIAFPGVKVESVQVQGALETFFESFDFDLSMAVDSSPTHDDVSVKATVPRLNHRDFAYNINIHNEKSSAAHAVVRIYLCPSMNNQGVKFTYDEGRWHCIEMDKFWKNLTPGHNHLVRKSSESSVTIPDIPSFSTLIHDADAAMAAGTEVHLEAFEQQCGIPNRMLLPKGSAEGMEFWLNVIVTDATGDDVASLEEGDTHTQCGVHGSAYPDHKPMGFPYDRPIADSRIMKGAENINSQKVKVYHGHGYHV